MNVNREQFLNSLNLVKGGLSAREFIEQSSCFVFQDGYVMTFNDEVACKIKVPLKITGAVQSATLLDILSKIDDEELDVRENESKELEFRAKRRMFGVTKEAEVFLPIDRVEEPKAWEPLPKAFTESIGLVQHCVSSDQSRFLLTCVHIHPEFVEACDNHQAMRCYLDTKIDGPVLVRGTSLEPLKDLGMCEFAMTKAWLHFRNNEGLRYSCRRYVEDYPTLDGLFKGKGTKVALPKGMVQAAECAQVFAADRVGNPLVTVKLFEGTIQVEGVGTSGWYKERKKVHYDGERLEFAIAPDLLKHVSDKYEEAILLPGKLKVRSEAWDYVTVLGAPEEPAAKDDKKAEEESED